MGTCSFSNTWRARQESSLKYRTIVLPSNKAYNAKTMKTKVYTCSTRQDQSNMVTGQSNTVTDQSNTVTDQSNALSDQSIAVSDQPNTVTDQSNTVTYQSCKHGNWLIKHGNWPIKQGNWPIKHGNWPIKHGNWPITKCVKQNLWLTVFSFKKIKLRILAKISCHMTRWCKLKRIYPNNNALYIGSKYKTIT